MAFQREVLGQMRRRGRFAAAAFEIDHRNDVQIFALSPMGQVAAFTGTTVLIEIGAQLQHLRGGIAAPARGRGLRFRAFALKVQFLDRGLGDAQKIGNLGQRKLA